MRQASAVEFPRSQDGFEGSEVTLQQLADLADALVEQVGAVRAHYENLQQTLDVPRHGAVPVIRARTSEEAEASSPSMHDSARLVIMEMAMSGSTRDETKEYLRETLEIEDGEPLVDEVFDRTEAAQSGAKLHRRIFARRRD